MFTFFKMVVRYSCLLPGFNNLFLRKGEKMREEYVSRPPFSSSATFFVIAPPFVSQSSLHRPLCSQEHHLFTVQVSSTDNTVQHSRHYEVLVNTTSSMKFVRSLCTIALSAGSASAFSGPSVVGRRAGGAAVASSRRNAMIVPAQQHVVASSSSRMLSTASSSSQLQMSSSAAADFVNSQVESNRVVVFSKSYCPFCQKTKALFEDLGVEATVFELNEMDDGADIQDALLDITGQRTVPNTFINGKHIGGNDDVQRANSAGGLKEMLAA